MPFEPLSTQRKQPSFANEFVPFEEESPSYNYFEADDGDDESIFFESSGETVKAPSGTSAMYAEIENDDIFDPAPSGVLEETTAVFEKQAAYVALVANAYGMVADDEISDFVADRSRALLHAQKNQPEYMREFQRQFDDAKGFFETAGVFLSNPRAIGRQAVTNSPNSILPLMTTLAGAKTGAAIGLAAPVPGGAALGAVVGGTAGSVPGGAIVEIGAEIDGMLQESGVDITDASAVLTSLQDDKLMENIKARAERKGLTTASVDALFQVFGGRFLKSAETGLVSKTVAGAKDVGVQSAGEGVGEAAGQLAREEGDISKVSFKEAALESVTSIAQSAGQTAIGATVGQAKKVAPKAKAKQPADSIDAVVSNIKDTGVDIVAEEKGTVVNISKIEVPDEQRGNGYAKAAIQEVVDYADATGKTVSLTPVDAFGSDKTRLVEMYKRFGFVENRGKNKDATIPETMYRKPPRTLAEEFVEDTEGKTLAKSQLKAELTRTVGRKRAAEIMVELEGARAERAELKKVEAEVAETKAETVESIKIETLRGIEELKQGATEEQIEALEQQKQLIGAKRARPKNLHQFVRSIGGLLDEHGEVSTLGLSNMIRKKGLDTDDAGLRAFEAGYFSERPTEAEFLDALADGDNLFAEDVSDIDQIESALIEIEEIFAATDIPALKETIARVGKFKKAQQRKIKKAETTPVLADKIKTFKRGFKKGKKVAMDNVKEAQTFLIDAIEKSGLSAADRAKFTRSIKNVQTAEQAARSIPKIQAKVETLLEKAAVREGKKRLAAMKKRVALKKGGKTPESKFKSADIQAEFNRRLDILKRRKGESVKDFKERSERQLSANLLEEGVNPVDNALLAINADVASSQVYNDVLADFQRLVEKAQSETARATAEKDVAAIEGIDAVTEVVGKTDVAKVDKDTRMQATVKALKQGRVSGGLYSYLVEDWNGMMDIVAGKMKGEAREKFNKLVDMFPSEQKQRALLADWNSKVRHFTLQAFGFDNLAQAQRQMNKDSKVTNDDDLGIFIYADGKERRVRMSKSEMRHILMMARNPELSETLLSHGTTETGERIGNNLTPTILQAMEDHMTLADNRLIEAQFAFYEELYQDINEVYRRIKGVDLPKVDIYSPASREGVVEEDQGFFSDVIGGRQSAGSKSSLKSRVRNRNPLRIKGDMEVLMGHMTEMAHFISHAEKMNVLRRVFNNSIVTSTLKERRGTVISAGITDMIDRFDRNGRYNMGILSAAMGGLRRNLVINVLGFKEQIGIKQLLSIFAAMESVNTVEFAQFTADFAKNPKKAWETLSETTFFKERGDSSNRDIRDVVSSSQFKNFMEKPTLVNWSTLSMRYGDKTAIAIAGWSIYKKALKDGKTHEQALEAFERWSLNTQQSPELSNLSLLQAGKFGEAGKIMSVFLTTPLQYQRKVNGAMRSIVSDIAKGRRPQEDAVKALFVYHILLPQLFQLAVNAGEFEGEDQLKAALLGNMNAIPLIGDAVASIAAWIAGTRIFDSTEMISGTFVNDIRRVKRAFDQENTLDEVKSLAIILSRAAPVPIEGLIYKADGISSLAEGEGKRASMQGIGYSPYTVEKATGGEKKKSKF